MANQIPGLRGANGQPASPPYSNGPYTWDQSISFSQGVGGTNTEGNIYYVDRNVSSSGKGTSWEGAFKTINEAITQVNTDYTAGQRNNVIFIGEGWYAELPQILTASDTKIISLAPGNHDSTVLYGVPVAGTFSGVAGGPALTVTGSNNTIVNLGVYTSDPLYGAIRNGSNAGDGDAANPGASAPTGNAFISCNAVRDAADGELCGIDELGGDGTLIQDCFFSTSCLTHGIRVRSNGVTNPVNPIVRDCQFVGTPIGVELQAGHNLLVKDCDFRDDTSDRPDVVDFPVIITATSGTVTGCSSALTKAAIVTGAGTIVDINNWGSDSST